MSGGPDAATLLERRLRIAAEAAGAVVSVGEAGWTRWASATFVGARHRLTVSGSGVAFDAWLAALPEADLPLRGHLVADVAVVARTSKDVVLEVLTVEER
ncbi:hypothetical protein [Sphingomonas sp. Leaf62]|uniref:hypothetical protein n=1 Tax=Sphingomonas sp. Leaf62 TaxID=1736228 RepID=UPI0006F8DC56|nr:hypothetical protein [Sphingomonas sp. Leaf62]KQN71145.1 hypothetical protein ASE91_08395 [Sphingomonas sp. Leaf62]